MLFRAAREDRLNRPCYVLPIADARHQERLAIVNKTFIYAMPVSNLGL